MLEREMRHAKWWRSASLLMNAKMQRAVSNVSLVLPGLYRHYCGYRSNAPDRASTRRVADADLAHLLRRRSPRWRWHH